MQQGFSPRVFVVVGSLTGLADPVLIAVVFRKFGAPYGVAAIVLWGVLTIPVALLLWSVTRRVRCPTCRSDKAKLTYDDRRTEYVSCSACGRRVPTGYSLLDF